MNGPWRTQMPRLGAERPKTPLDGKGDAGSSERGTEGTGGSVKLH
jgi:hypothetical protein